MKKKPLHVSLHVHEPSVVELMVADRVQLDRMMPSPHGDLAERHGRLLTPGTTRLALEPGHYFFRTLSDSNLRVVTGGVTARVLESSKTLPPPPGLPPPPDRLRGDEAPGKPPTLIVE